MKQGAAVYETNCAACHDHPVDRIPARSYIVITKSPEFIIRTLTTGAMVQQGSALTPEQRVAVATYLVGKAPSAASTDEQVSNRCASAPAPLVPRDTDWNGWDGVGQSNTRFRRTTGLNPGNLGKLELRWAFAYAGGASGQPAVIGGQVFAPSIAGVFTSLDAKTGCTYWATDVGAPLRSAVTVGKLPSGRFAAYIGDMHGEVHALDTETGKEVWRTRIEAHRMTRLTGSVTLYGDYLYAPVSSFEETAARDPNYACCTFRGGLVKLDAATGRIVWKIYTIDAEAAPLGDGHHFAPAGGAVWSAPTIDVKRNVVYINTGNAYTEPAAPTTNATIAIDMNTGERRWVRQFFPDDTFVDGCMESKAVNCPKGDLGPDFDMGGPPMLVSMKDGKQVVVLTSKSGMVFALDPDNKGELLWKSAAGRGGLMGGTEWGGASDGSNVYVPITDIGGRGREPDATMPLPGLYVFSAATGKPQWHVPAPVPVCTWGQPCFAAYQAAPTVIPGVVFSGGFDGRERAYATDDGRLLWEFDTGHSFDAVNGGTATGGSIDQGGQLVVGNSLFVNSGARNGYPGNLLLALSLPGDDHAATGKRKGASRHPAAAANPAAK